MQVVIKHGKQPTSVIVDLPCTLFMLDSRKLPIVEHVARHLTFSPRITVRLCACFHKTVKARRGLMQLHSFSCRVYATEPEVRWRRWSRSSVSVHAVLRASMRVLGEQDRAFAYSKRIHSTENTRTGHVSDSRVNH